MNDPFHYVFRKVLDEPGRSYEIDLELTAAEYAAIGRVSAQWAFLDYHITEFCTLVCEKVGETMHDDFDSDSFRKRKRAWQALVERVLEKPERDSMLAIIKDVGALQGERQKAIHSFFSYDKSDRSLLKGHSHKNPGGRPRTFSAKPIEKIADKIAALNAKFIMWPDDYPSLLPAATYRHRP